MIFLDEQVQPYPPFELDGRTIPHPISSIQISDIRRIDLYRHQRIFNRVPDTSPLSTLLDVCYPFQPSRHLGARWLDATACSLRIPSSWCACAFWGAIVYFFRRNDATLDFPLLTLK